MAATADAAPELKRLAGRSARGRKLEKPVCHYSLSWAKDEVQNRQEMSRAAAESLKALGLEKHQALIVAHRDGHPHVHVIVNRAKHSAYALSDTGGRVSLHRLARARASPAGTP